MNINKITHYLRFLPSAIKKDKIIELTYFVTEKCNMSCPHCFNHFKNSNINQDELNLDEIGRLSSTMGPLLRLLISGGEPFLRHDFADLCITFIKNTHSAHLTIPTNGSLPQKIAQDVERIAISSPGTFVEIKISLDQLGEKRDIFTSYPGGFNKMLESIKLLKELQKFLKNIGIGVIITCVPENQNDLNILYDFARKTLQVEHCAIGLARGHKGYCPEVDVARFFAFYIDKFFKGGKLNIPFYNIIKRVMLYRTYLDVRYRNGRNKFIPCFSGRIRAVMDPYGTLYPCETKGYPYFSPSQSIWNMGNIREFGYDFKKLWHSERAKKIREEIKRSKCVCNHGCDMNINILFNMPVLLEALLLPINRMQGYPIKEKNNNI